MDAYQRIARQIDAGKYDPKYHHNMTVRQRTDERQRVTSRFMDDVLAAYEAHDLGIRLDLLDMAWTVYEDLGYLAVLEGFHRMLTTP